MARTTAGLPAGSRISDFISLDVLAKSFPAAKVHEVLACCGKSSVRRRDLPAHVVVYYVIALGLYMNCSRREALRCLLEGLQWLREPAAPRLQEAALETSAPRLQEAALETSAPFRTASRSGIS